MREASQNRTPDTQLFRDVFNASPIGIAVENLEGQPLFVNPALCSILGFSEEELRNKHCVDFSPHEDAEKDWALFQQLRAGVIDHYQLEKRYFKRDGSLVWGCLTISLMKGASPLVVAMVEDITEKRRAQEELLRAQGDLELVANQMAAAVTRCSRDFRYLWANRRYANWLRRPLNEIVGRPILDVLGKDAFEALQRYFERVLAGEKVDYEEEVNFSGIGRRWISAAYTPTWDSDTSVNGWVAVVLDVTERKLAEATLANVSRRLIEAQEQERTRIGRDLHDDIVQRLALLSLELEGVEADIPDVELRDRIGALRNQATQIADDVQLLSHELHSKLDYLGIVEAAKNFCEEFGERQKVEIDFQSHDLPTGLPTELSLSLFRVLQEALRNAAKHSGVKRFEVRLWGSKGEIELTISDLGAGFDTETAIKSTGLGLTSMQERLRLVHGELSINSQPRGGTTIHARVPFDSSSDSARAAG
jgi:PAS domain S-box-containing protein